MRHVDCSVPDPPVTPLLVDSNSVLPVTSVRDLGIYLDSDTSITHVSKTTFCCFNALCQIRSIRRSVSKPVLLSLATSLVLDYGSTNLAGISGRLLDRLQSVLNADARMVCDSRKYDHISPLLRDLRDLCTLASSSAAYQHSSGRSRLPLSKLAPWTVSLDIRRDLYWLPVSHRVTFKLCLIIWKTFHTAHPPYLSELITHYRPSRALPSSNTNLLARPSGIADFTSRAFSVSAPSTCNSLPAHIHSVS